MLKNDIQTVLNIITEAKSKGIEFFLERGVLKLKVYEDKLLNSEFLEKVKKYKKELTAVINQTSMIDGGHAVKLNNVIDKRPCFLFPGMPGFVDHYTDVSVALESIYTIYGIPFFTDNSKKTPFKSVKELVVYAKSEILKKAISVPLTFIGHSLGAYVAFETVRQLEVDGIEVEQLILLDTSANTTIMLSSAEANQKYLSGIEYFLDTYQLQDALPSTWKREIGSMLSVTGIGGQASTIYNCFKESLFNREVNQFYLEVLHSLLYQLDMDYQPSGKINTDTLIISAEQENWPAKNNYLSWKNYCINISGHTTPGDHLTLVQDHNAMSLADQIIQYITIRSDLVAEGK